MLALRDQTLRFSEIRRAIGGVSERMLAQTLRYMEEDGLLVRKAYDVVPPHVEYRLTAGPRGERACAGANRLAGTSLSGYSAAAAKPERRT